MHRSHGLAAFVASAALVIGVSTFPALARAIDAEPAASSTHNQTTAESPRNETIIGDRSESARRGRTGEDITGVILSYDKSLLVVAGVAGKSSTSFVTRNTVVKVEKLSYNLPPRATFERGSTVHLREGSAVADIVIDEKSGVLEEISVYR